MTSLISAGNVISQMPKLEVPVSLTIASPGRMKDWMAGQSWDWVRWADFASSGVRGGGSCGFGILCCGVDGRAAVRATRRDFMAVLG